MNERVATWPLRSVTRTVTVAEPLSFPPRGDHERTTRSIATQLEAAGRCELWIVGFDQDGQVRDNFTRADGERDGSRRRVFICEHSRDFRENRHRRQWTRIHDREGTLVRKGGTSKTPINGLNRPIISARRQFPDMPVF